MYEMILALTRLQYFACSLSIGGIHEYSLTFNLHGLVLKSCPYFGNIFSRRETLEFYFVLFCDILTKQRKIKMFSLCLALQLQPWDEQVICHIAPLLHNMSYASTLIKFANPKTLLYPFSMYLGIPLFYAFLLGSESAN